MPKEVTYEERGVSPHKPDVEKAAEGVDKGIYPGAFCKIIEDAYTGSDEYCVALHADGVGTKAIIAYLVYRETGNAEVFRDIAQDSIVMNLDDLLCIGVTGPFVMSNTIGRNAKRIPGDIIKNIIVGYENFCDLMSDYGVEIKTCGGETADLGDLVRTVVIDSTISVRMKREDVIDASNVKPGDIIIGLASFGQAIYEKAYNSGIGTNGMTSARHDILSGEYKEKYPETFAPEIEKYTYNGKFRLDDKLPKSGMTIGQALLSPTRTYAPVLKKIANEKLSGISAMFHNTGGGLTKCIKFGNNVSYVKDNLFEMPEIFQVLKDTGIPAREMIRIYNLGQRFEIICAEELADTIISISREFSIDAKIIGQVTGREKGVGVEVVIDENSHKFENNEKI